MSQGKASRRYGGLSGHGKVKKPAVVVCAHSKDIQHLESSQSFKTLTDLRSRVYTYENFYPASKVSSAGCPAILPFAPSDGGQLRAHTMRLSWFFVSSAACLLLSCCGRNTPPFSPAEALKTIQLAPEWRIDLYASEPLFADPVAMEIDEDGRVYVVQNSGYPLNTEEAVGKVWLLTDTDGDGKPDRSTIFADKLILPTGVTRWKKGILVTDAPNVWYLEDSDGDGKADVKRAVLTGFAFTNPQHTVNSPTYGLDNWIYLAHEGFASSIVFEKKFGDRGSDIHFADRPAPVVKNERRNVRFRPDSFQLETTSSTSQFGLAFDDFGRLLTVNNSNHARQEMLAARYLSRNPDLLISSAMQDTSDHGAAAQVFFSVKNPRFELLSGSGIFTSACGITWFNGGTLVAEPVHSLVHRDIWSPNGPTFVAKRDRPDVEFLSSTDNWFRPVNFYNGPDGELYVVDYYRKIIEHPEWTSKEVYESKEIYDGKDLGRIYRVTPAAARPAAPARPRLSQASSADLVAKLESPQIWWRRNAQRLLVDRHDLSVVPALVRLATASASPLGRLHALWTLDGIGQLSPDLVAAALADVHPGVRENAIILAESRLQSPVLVARLLALAGDADPRVRFQLLATLGYLHSPEAARVRQALLRRDIDNHWFHSAALSADSGEALPTLLSSTSLPPGPGPAAYLQQLGSVVGARSNAAELSRLFQAVASAPPAAPWRGPAIEGAAAGVRARHPKLPAFPVLLNLAEDPDLAVRRGALRLLDASPKPPAFAPALARALAAAPNRALPGPRRADALRLLAILDPARPLAFFEPLANPSEPEEVQLAAVQSIGKLTGDGPAKLILARWRAMTPSIRAEAASLLVASPEHFKLLLDAIEKGEIQAWSLPSRQRVQMQMNRDPALRERARKLLAAGAGDREAVVRRYQAVLEKNPGDSRLGRPIFDNICAKCHKLNGVGAEVGPDLATVRNRTPDSLLTDILIPSRSIAQMFEAYVVETTSGSYEGVIGEQTSTTITLVHEQQKKDVIPRAEIKQLFVSNLSVMPEDLDKEISPEQMAHLIAYLRKPQ